MCDERLAGAGAGPNRLEPARGGVCTTDMKTHRFLRAAFVLGAVAFVIACDNAGDGSPSTHTTAPAIGDITNTPSTDSLTLSGTITLDGVPLDAPFLGARVISNDGLAAACQDDIPAVTAGRYEIQVASDGEVRGCGAPGARVVLWIFAGDRYFFSTTAVPWPDEGSDARFDAAFSSPEPLGSSTPVTEFKGRLRDANGADLPAGTVVEAYAGDTRCAVTSLRPVEQTEGFYTLIVAGPDAVPGCDRDAPLSFRLDGKQAVETAVNDLASGAGGHELDLTLK